MSLKQKRESVPLLPIAVVANFRVHVIISNVKNFSCFSVLILFPINSFWSWINHSLVWSFWWCKMFSNPTRNINVKNNLWDTIFSAPEPLAQVHYCDHVLFVVCPSSLTLHIFNFSSETAERNSRKLDRKQDLNVLYQVTDRHCFS